MEEVLTCSWGWPPGAQPQLFLKVDQAESGRNRPLPPSLSPSAPASLSVFSPPPTVATPEPGGLDWETPWCLENRGKGRTWVTGTLQRGL